MKFRLLLLVGALFAAIASLPPLVRMAIAIVLAVWFGVDMGIELRNRRASREWAKRSADPVPDWVDCGAVYFARFGADPLSGGLSGECHKQKGHDGPHEASISAEWPA